MNSNLQNKLQQFSPSPPAGVWDKIAEALDENGTFAERLYQYEEAPPAGNWQNIVKQLADTSQPARIVPFHKRLSTPVRYAVVASLLAVMLVTITLTVKRTEAGALEAESNTTVPTRETTVTAGVSKSQQVQTGQPSANATKKENNLTVKDNVGYAEEQEEIVSFATPQPTSKNNSRALKTASLQQYVTFSDDEGIVRKVSKKIAGMVNCKDSDRACKERLRQLRQKMATNAMTTDFTGILEMLQQLQ